MSGSPPAGFFASSAREEFGRLVEALGRLQPASAEDILDGLEEAGATDDLMSILRASVSDLKGQSKDVEAQSLAEASRSGASTALKAMLAMEQLSDEERQRVELVTMALIDVVWRLMGEPETPHDIATTLFGTLGKLDAGGVRPNMPADELLRKLNELLRALPPAKRRRVRPEPPLPDYMRLTADRIQQGVFEALCRLHEWQRDVPILDKADREAAFAHAFVVESPGLRLIVGYPRPSEELLEALADDETNTLTLKLTPVLTERWFEQSGGDPREWARRKFLQLCSDLLRRNKGGFRPDQKVRVANAYDALTGLHVYAEWTVRDQQFALRPNSLWDSVDALHKRAGAATTAVLNWRPGEWWSDPAWRQDNSYLGHVGKRLLELDHRNKWATRLAIDYAMLARRRRKELKADQHLTEPVWQIVERIGFDQAYSGRRARQKAAFEEAHETLIELGLLLDHDYDRPGANWRNRHKVLRFPAEMNTLPGQLKLPLPDGD